MANFDDIQADYQAYNGRIIRLSALTERMERRSDIRRMYRSTMPNERVFELLGDLNEQQRNYLLHTGRMPDPLPSLEIFKPLPGWRGWLGMGEWRGATPADMNIYLDHNGHWVDCDDE